MEKTTMTVNSYASFFCAVVSLIFIGVGSCNTEPETEAEAVCDCSANITSTFENLPAIAISTADGYYLLSPEKGFLNICDGFDDNGKTNGLMILASGKLKSTCEMENDYNNIAESFVQVDSYQVSDDSLFNKLPGTEIHIFKSEDYGYPVGYGYTVKTSAGSMKIFQPHMPAVQGLIPFKSPQDAFKIAVLVAYKLNNGLVPAIAVSDLEFFLVL
jgi:hypothetical protein